MSQTLITIGTAMVTALATKGIEGYMFEITHLGKAFRNVCIKTENIEETPTP